jgi:hypothetical protein
MISKSEAIDLARQECDRRGISWEGSVRVVGALRVITVWIDADKRGGNVIVRLGRRKGEVRKFLITPK